MLRKISLTLACIVALAWFVSCREDGGAAEAGPTGESKIRFDLDTIGDDGLVGPPDGRRSVSYEFCVPGDAELVDQVRQIDATLEVYPDSRGRIGCSEDESLCIGNTHQPEFRGVLLKLAALPYVKEIHESHFE